VGVCESDKTDSRPLEKQPTVKFDKLLLGVALGKRDEDTLTTLAGRLARLDRELDSAQRQQITEIAGGKTIAQMSAMLLRAIDPNAIAERATGMPGTSPAEVAPEKFEAAKKALVLEACAPFDQPALRDTLVKLKQQNEQTIDTVTADVVTHQGFDAAAKEKAANLLKSFRDYIEQHQAEITALQILYSRPFKQRLTEKMLKELEKKLRDNHAAWTEDRLWDAFAVTAPGKVKGRSQAARWNNSPCSRRSPTLCKSGSTNGSWIKPKSVSRLRPNNSRG
jgi:type I restriction enzyme R subunit